MNFLAIFVCYKRSMGGGLHDIHQLSVPNLFIFIAWLFNRLGTTAYRSSGRNPNQCFDLYGNQFFTLFPMLYGSDQMFRVGSSIISGVGFLCSGVIFKDSGSVRGMNTADTLWCTAAIGILSSTGMYAMAISAAAILITSNLILRPLARKLNPIMDGDEMEKQYRISVICQQEAERDVRLLLINSNPCKTLYLNHLESCDVVGNKVEIIAGYRSFGKTKNNILEGIVGRMLSIAEVSSAAWEVL